jgi:hypothetical protein
MLVSPDTFSDFELSADVSTVNREASLAFRIQDQPNGYIAIFEPDGIPPFPGGIWFARRVAWNETYPLYSHPDPFPTAGEVAHLRIVGQGSTFELELNGVSLGTVEDSTFSSGKLGLRINGDAGLPVDARFSNVVATDTTSPTPTATSTVTPEPETPTPTATPGGTELGFLPDVDGYSFKNGLMVLTWDMFEHFFGTENVEYPNGEERADAWQFYRDFYAGAGLGGSCDGFSATSLINWGRENQSGLGEFPVPDHHPLFDAGEQNDMWYPIAYHQGVQLGWELFSGYFQEIHTSHHSPKYYFEKIKQHIASGDAVILWLEPRAAESQSGHSVVPYKVEESGDTGWVYVYDSNHVGSYDRKVKFDLAHDEWEFDFNPQTKWHGDSVYGALGVHTVDPYLHKGIPPWTVGHGAGSPGALVGVKGPAEIDLDDPDAELFIPVADGSRPFSLYYVPGADHGATLDGTGTDSATIDVFIDGALAAVETSVTGSTLDRIEPEPDGSGFSYETSDKSKTYSATLDTELGGTSRVVTVADSTIASGETATFEMTPDETFKYVNQGGARHYDLVLTQLGNGAGSFEQDDISIGANETHIITPANWDALSTSSVTLEIDEGNDGTIDQTLTLDQTMPAAWSNKCYVGPEQPIEEALAGIIGDVLAVYRLSGSQSFETWFPGRPDASTITTVRPYEPLFVLMTKDAAWPQTPSSTPPTSANLAQGWNNVCYAGTAKAPEDATSGIAGDFAILYTLGSDQAWGHYVPGRPEASDVAQLDQYDAVLMLVTKQGGTVWTFDP